ncbi:MAG TPA: hypothetical protein PLD20_00320 [Blastocatellia bacterium]|nr:hypothetical protein [Blastocatellia bacterium]HMX25041.1 hypothetical protein [Blastocatellia bacterium]HMZ16378.1 hypothetical protein [Blastocatellia bacterium]
MKTFSPFFKTAVTLSLVVQSIVLPCSEAAHLVTGLSSSQANSLVAKPQSVTLESDKPGQLLTITQGDQPLGADVTLAPAGAFDADLLEFKERTLSAKPGLKLAADERRTIKLKTPDGRETNEISVTVKTNLKPFTVKVDGQEGALQPQTTVTLSAGEKRTLTVEAKLTDGSALPNSDKLKLAAEDGSTGALDLQGLTITAKDVSRDTDVAVKLLLGDQKISLFKFKVHVLAIATTIDFAPRPSPQIFEGSDSPPFQVIMRRNGTPLSFTQGREVKATSNNNKLQIIQDGDRFTMRGLLWPKPPDGTQAPSSDPATVTFKLVQSGVTQTSAAQELVNVQLIKREGFISFVPPIVEPLLPNGKVTTMAQVRERDGRVNPALVHFDFNNRSDEKWATLATEGNQLTVYWRNPSPSEQETRDGNGNIVQLQRPSQIEITATALINNQPLVSTLSIRLEQVTDFVPLKVKLNVMDEKMAGNLYGSVTAKENYVLTLRLFNNLKEDKSKQTLGASLLAYCASVEIAVGLEKRFNPKLKSALPLVLTKDEADLLAKKRNAAINTSADTQVTADLGRLENLKQRATTAVNKLREAEAAAEEKTRLVELLRYELLAGLDSVKTGDLKAAERDAMEQRVKADLAHKELTAIKTELLRLADSRAAVYQLLAEMTDPDVPVDDGKWHPLRLDDLHRIAETFEAVPLPSRQILAQSRDNNEPPCVGVITYRPYTFEMMVNTVDRRDERSARAIVFKVLSGFGTAASLATAIPSLKSAGGVATDSGLANFQLFLDKYTNLLLPAAERLFPSLKETHRQNIVAQAMKPIEEIPFGSDITRVLFIPKKEIHGLVRGHDVRISEICPYYFSIEVAVVQKGGVVQKGAATP